MQSASTSPIKIPVRSSSKHRGETSLKTQFLKHKESRKRLPALKKSLQEAKKETSLLQAISTYEELVKDTAIHERLLEMKKQTLDLQLLNNEIKPERYIKKSNGIIKRTLQVNTRLKALQRQKLQEKMRINPSYLPESGIVTAVIQFLLSDPQGKRKSREQSSFKDAILDKYELRHPTNKDKIWDVVTGTYQWKSLMKAAHIVPARINAEIMDYVLGPGSASRKYSWQNGLMLTNTIEELLDKACIVLVPAVTENNSIRPNVFVLRIARSGVENKSIVGPDGGEIKLAEINGKALEFRNDNRPALRFLYYRYITTMLSNHWFCMQYAKTYYDELRSPKLWITLGSYLRKGVLISMAKRSGCVDEKTISATLANIPDNEEEEELVSEHSVNELITHATLMNPGESDEECLDEESELESENEGQGENKDEDIEIDTEEELSENEN